MEFSNSKRRRHIVLDDDDCNVIRKNKNIHKDLFFFSNDYLFLILEFLTINDLKILSEINSFYYVQIYHVYFYNKLLYFENNIKFLRDLKKHKKITSKFNNLLLKILACNLFFNKTPKNIKYHHDLILKNYYKSNLDKLPKILSSNNKNIFEELEKGKFNDYEFSYFLDIYKNNVLIKKDIYDKITHSIPFNPIKLKFLMMYFNLVDRHFKCMMCLWDETFLEEFEYEIEDFQKKWINSNLLDEYRISKNENIKIKKFKEWFNSKEILEQRVLQFAKIYGFYELFIENNLFLTGYNRILIFDYGLKSKHPPNQKHYFLLADYSIIDKEEEFKNYLNFHYEKIHKIYNFNQSNFLNTNEVRFILTSNVLNHIKVILLDDGVYNKERIDWQKKILNVFIENKLFDFCFLNQIRKINSFTNYNEFYNSKEAYHIFVEIQTFILHFLCKKNKYLNDKIRIKYLDCYFNNNIILEEAIYQFILHHIDKNEQLPSLFFKYSNVVLDDLTNLMHFYKLKKSNLPNTLVPNTPILQKDFNYKTLPFKNKYVEKIVWQYLNDYENFDIFQIRNRNFLFLERWIIDQVVHKSSTDIKESIKVFHNIHYFMKEKNNWKILCFEKNNNYTSFLVNEFIKSINIRNILKNNIFEDVINVEKKFYETIIDIFDFVVNKLNNSQFIQHLKNATKYTDIYFRTILRLLYTSKPNISLYFINNDFNEKEKSLLIYLILGYDFLFYKYEEEIISNREIFLNYENFIEKYFKDTRMFFNVLNNINKIKNFF